MKKLCDLFKEIPEEVKLSKLDFLLTIAVCFLCGGIIGMIISPRKTKKYKWICGNTGVDSIDDDDEIYE